MSGIVVNTGGGGLVIGGLGGMATGAGSVTVLGNTGTEPPRTLDTAAFGAFLAALGSLKSALIVNGVRDGQILASAVTELESRAIQRGGAIDPGDVRRVLGAVRYAAVEAPPVLEALAAASAPVRSARPSDVFISYKREERARATPFLEAFRKLAVSVWIDDLIAAGQSFTTVICEEIEVCRAQVVLWSAASVSSDWVCGEAQFGHRRGVLVPVALDDCPIRPPFNMIHAEPMIGWAGDLADSSWCNVIDVIGPKLGRPDLGDLSRALGQRDAGALTRWIDGHPADPFVTRGRQDSGNRGDAR
jgi:hypothetical protein